MNMGEWAEQEIRIACKKENPDWDGESFDYGCSCYQSALKAYKSLMEDGHSGCSFGVTKNILIRLMNGQPLTPIEDVPEVWKDVNYGRNDEADRFQCKRMFSLFKDVYPDGTVKYNDVDRYYCIERDERIPYHGGGSGDILNEYFPIKMPYMPENEKYKIVTKTILRYPGVGNDFDAKAYHYIETPDGKHIKVHRFFGEVDGEWKEVNYKTWVKWLDIARRNRRKATKKEENDG